MNEKIPVAVIAATGAVGQRFCSLLQDHPWFDVVAVTASERSAGKLYRDAVNWVVPGEIPAHVADLTVGYTEPHDRLEASLNGAKLVLSALPSGPAREIEPALIERGYAVVTNASALRMVEDVPLMIPEVNHEHIGLLDAQIARHGSGGFAVAMANCSSTGSVMQMKALHDAFTIEAAHIVTMQAISGAGYPGVSSFDILDNVIPYIGNEEDKIESEPRKMLGTLSGAEINFAPITVSAQVHRVPVMDGHMVAMSVKLRDKASLDDVLEALRAFKVPEPIAKLPSTPEFPMLLRDEIDRPQPRRDRHTGNGMTVSVGRVQPCPVLDYKLVALSHNTIRGAAGGAIQAAEWVVASGYLDAVMGEPVAAAVG